MLMIIMRKNFTIGTDNKCRLCKQFVETVENIVTACQILAVEQYVKRNNSVPAEMYFNICKEIRV